MTSQLPFPEEVISKIKLFCAKTHPTAEGFFHYFELHLREGVYWEERLRNCESFHQYLDKRTNYYVQSQYCIRQIFLKRIYKEQKLREKKERRRQRKLRNNLEN